MIFQLELFCAVNALQFVFIPLKLDGFVQWTWEVVFIPVWIVLCLSLIMVLYSIIFCSILLRTPDISAQQKHVAITSAVGNCTTILPALAFQILLSGYTRFFFINSQQIFNIFLISDKLDGDLNWPFIYISCPLLFSLFTLILLSFSSKSQNKWWFGMRKSFCQFVLAMLNEYGNISYAIESSDQIDNGTNVPLESNLQFDEKNNKKITFKKIDYTKPIAPIVNIDMPD